MKMFKYLLSTFDGSGKRRVVFTAKSQDATEASNECFRWILDHTSFSFHEATNQGYMVEDCETDE